MGHMVEQIIRQMPVAPALETTYETDMAEGLKAICLLYTSDAADERSSVDLGGRRIIKKKKKEELRRSREEDRKGRQYNVYT